MTYVKINITTSEYRLPSGRKFARLVHDYELYGVSRATWTEKGNSILGLPETIKVLYSEFVEMKESWQYFWVDLFSLSKFKLLYNELSEIDRNYINSAFKSATAGFRAFTNGRGWDNGYCDFINGVNLDSGPMQQETITCGGNIVEVIGDKLRLAGSDVYKVRTLNGNKLPPNPLTVEPWLVFTATISRREKILNSRGRWDGKSWKEDIVTPFPQLDGADVRIPFMGSEDFNYIRAERIRILPENSTIPSPYHI